MQSSARPSPVRSARSDPAARRRSILEATLRLIARGGIDAVTHRRVASEADVSLSSTTYYFATREDMIREAFRHKLTRSAASATTQPEPRVTTAAQAIEVLVAWAEHQLAAPDDLLAEHELILYTARDSGLSRELDAAHAAEEMRIAATLEQLGAPRPLDAARTVSGVMRAFEIECLTRPDTRVADLRRRLELLIPALLSTGSPEAGA